MSTFSTGSMISYKRDPCCQYVGMPRRHTATRPKRADSDDLIDSLVRQLSTGRLCKDLHGNKNMYYQVNATYFSAGRGRKEVAPRKEQSNVYAWKISDMVSRPNGREK